MARPAAAQTTGFLTRTDWVLLWSNIAADDPRFTWQGRFALDADLADYRSGRVILTADYYAVLGGERRRWDLNQSNYRFEVAATRRTRFVELAAHFGHVSRHLVDRANPPSISWNTLGARAMTHWTFGAGGRTTIDSRLQFAKAMQQAYVDYDWISDARVTLRHALASHPRVSFLADATGIAVRNKEEMYGRSKVCGGRIEGGVRVNAERAAIEIFAGYERRIDAYPTDRFRVRMWTVGFRLVSR
jgi:hypothetical protein